MKSLAWMIAVAVALCAEDADSQALTTLATFTGFGGNGPANDAGPLGSLTYAGTTLYGTASGGGAGNVGAVFSVGTDGSDFQNLVSFTNNGGTAMGVEPAGDLTLVGTTLFGTVAGGANGFGTLFSVSTDGTSYQAVVSFTGASGTANGSGPGNLAYSGTTLYGMTGGGGFGYGNIFSVGLNGTNYQNLVSFTGTGGTANGREPMGGVTLAGATAFGMTYEGGIPNINGTGYGNVFSAGVDGTNYQNLVSFTGSPGTANGAAAVWQPDVRGRSPLWHDSLGRRRWAWQYLQRRRGRRLPECPLVYGHERFGKRRVSTGQPDACRHRPLWHDAQGGAYGYGNIFSVGLDGSGYQNLYSFTGGSDGAYPQASLTIGGGTLFGATTEGGIGAGFFGDGTVFALALPQSALAPPTFTWSQSGGGSWSSSGNWTPAMVPNGAGWQAILGSALTVSSTITLDGNQTVGSLVFNNGTASYAISCGSGGTLTLDNSTYSIASQLLVLAGSHSIAAPVTIAGGGLTISESSNSSLLIAGNIGDDNGLESLTLGGDGTGILVLCGTNTYGGGTNVVAGTLVVMNPAALLDGSNVTVGAEAVSMFGAVDASADEATAVPEPSTLALLGFGAMRAYAAAECRYLVPHTALTSMSVVRRSQISYQKGRPAALLDQDGPT